MYASANRTFHPLQVHLVEELGNVGINNPVDSAPLDPDRQHIWHIMRPVFRSEPEAETEERHLEDGHHISVGHHLLENPALQSANARQSLTAPPWAQLPAGRATPATLAYVRADIRLPDGSPLPEPHPASRRSMRPPVWPC